MVTASRKTKAIREFGDFQTPPELAAAAVRLLAGLGISPGTVLEPTCGVGAFVAAAKEFSDSISIVGYDINTEYLEKARTATAGAGARVVLQHGDFFKVNWRQVLNALPKPWLILGNPPWVTSSELGSIAGTNLPQKSNFHGLAGIEAITGKSNFDISEWMLHRYLEWLSDSGGTIAVLCKTTVARKLLRYIWKQNLALKSAKIFGIDAQASFGAAVDACFFVLEVEHGIFAKSCDVYDAISSEVPTRSIGFHDGHLIGDVPAFNRRRNLLGPEKHYVWRSGIKHDCSKVMELKVTSEGMHNGLGEIVSLEDAVTFPLLKSSDIGNGRTNSRGVMIVPQKSVGADTIGIRFKAPKTWDYLARHAAMLDARASSIYKDKPPFSIFGVGPYSFSPWKVAISGFYKRLLFVKVGPENGRPVVFDDTVYFLPSWSEEEADFIMELLNSAPAREFYESMINWDEKRPITVEILKRLSLEKVAAVLEKQDSYSRFVDLMNAEARIGSMPAMKEQKTFIL